MFSLSKRRLYIQKEKLIHSWRFIPLHIYLCSFSKLSNQIIGISTTCQRASRHISRRINLMFFSSQCLLGASGRQGSSFFLLPSQDRSPGQSYLFCGSNWRFKAGHRPLSESVFFGMHESDPLRPTKPLFRPLSQSFVQGRNVSLAFSTP